MVTSRSGYGVAELAGDRPLLSTLYKNSCRPSTGRHRRLGKDGGNRTGMIELALHAESSPRRPDSSSFPRFRSADWCPPRTRAQGSPRGRTAFRRSRQPTRRHRTGTCAGRRRAGSASRPAPAGHLAEARAGQPAEFTLAHIRDYWDVGDWFPDDHPPMPDVVVHGSQPHVRGCAMCHMPNGKGRPENAPVAGQPYATSAADDRLQERPPEQRRAAQAEHHPDDRGGEGR